MSGLGFAGNSAANGRVVVVGFGGVGGDRILEYNLCIWSIDGRADVIESLVSLLRSNKEWWETRETFLTACVDMVSW